MLTSNFIFKDRKQRILVIEGQRNLMTMPSCINHKCIWSSSIIIVKKILHFKTVCKNDNGYITQLKM